MKHVITYHLYTYLFLFTKQMPFRMPSNNNRSLTCFLRYRNLFIFYANKYVAIYLVASKNVFPFMTGVNMCCSEVIITIFDTPI